MARIVTNRYGEAVEVEDEARCDYCTEWFPESQAYVFYDCTSRDEFCDEVFEVCPSCKDKARADGWLEVDLEGEAHANDNGGVR